MYGSPKNVVESDRINALDRYEILDTPPDAVLDCITLAAKDLCGTPMALISLIDETRQWFKSSIGVAVSETPRSIAFCSHAIQVPNDIMEVEDATKDERFRDNPLVTGEPNIRFYAGKPLLTSDGFPLGTLCVLDIVPRRLSNLQRNALSRLSDAIINQFEAIRKFNISSIASAYERTQAQASNERLARIVEESINEIYVLNANNFQVLSMNRTARQNLGFSIPETLALFASDFTDGLMSEKNIQQFTLNGENKRQNGIIEYVHKRKDGTTYPVSVHMQYMKSQNPPVYVGTVCMPTMKLG